jgi:hypothetical protein
MTVTGSQPKELIDREAKEDRNKTSKEYGKEKMTMSR